VTSGQPRWRPLVAAGVGVGLALQCLPAHTLAAPADADDLAERVVQLTNAEREAAQLPPLTAQVALGQAAQQYAAVLASGSCFAHTCGPVPGLPDRVDLAGYGRWTALSENIAAGQPSPEAVVTAWMNSPAHRANILNPAYAEMGVGAVASSGSYRMYWVEEFGAR
jgi:uncharacterized protein YkwD